MADLTTLLSKFLTALYAGFGTGITYNPSGVISVNVTPVSNVSTTETDLMTFALPANALSANGKGVRITAWGTNAANANTKTVKVYFGATAVAVIGPAASNGNGWWIQATVVRSGATAQIATGNMAVSNLTPVPLSTSPAETLSGAVTIKATGTSGTGSNDVTQTGMVIEALA